MRSTAGATAPPWTRSRRSARGARGLGRAARTRPRRGRGGRSQPRLPRDPAKARRADEAGGFVQGPSARTFERLLLAERAGIGRGDLRSCARCMPAPADTCGRLSARTSFRGAASRAARGSENRHRCGGCPGLHPEPPVDEHAQVQPSEPAAPDRRHDTEPAWETLYDRLERDWNDLVAGANRAGLPLPLVRGYDELIGRVQDLAEHPRLPSTEHQELTGTARLPPHGDGLPAASFTTTLRAAEHHVKACEPLHREAETPGRRILPRSPVGRSGAERSAASRRGRQSHPCRRGYLRCLSRRDCRRKATRPPDRRPIGVAASTTDASRQPSRRSRSPAGDPAPKRQEGIAYILDEPERLRELREKIKKREHRIGRQHKRSRGLTP